MSRKGSTPIRVGLADPKHNSAMVARFINMVMKSGKKSVAERIVYGALGHIGEKHAAPVDVVGQLTQLAALRDQGVLTAAEFEAQKAKILAS